MVDVAASSGKSPRLIGRYALFDEVAAGGMATVHIGRLVGPVGFSRTVAIKRLHPQFAKDPEFVTGFLDEARLAARIRHPNVVPTLDVVASHGELFLVMEYVLGESFATLLRTARDDWERPPHDVICSIVSGTLHGLHAAHEAKSERGEPLGIVHRDVSPQNILVGVDGVARVLDFGIAKAAGRAQITRDGQVKGKMAYVAPEQFQLGTVNRKVDIYAAAVVLWEALTGERLFRGESEGATIARVLTGEVQPPSAFDATLSPELDALVLRGLNRDPAERFDTARDMALALEACASLAPPSRVGEWVEHMAGNSLVRRAQAISQVEQVGEFSATDASSGPLRQAITREEPTAVVDLPSGAIHEIMRVEPAALQVVEAQVLPRRRRSKAGVFLVFAGVVGVALGIWFGSIPRTKTPTSAPAPAVSTDLRERAAEKTEEVAKEPAAPAPESTEKLDESAPPAADESAAAQAPAPTSSGRAPSPARERGSAAPRRLGRAHCSPPYTIDEAGHRHYKMECL
jgi:hypothetical protein